MKVELRGLADWLDMGQRKGGDKETNFLVLDQTRMEPCFLRWERLQLDRWEAGRLESIGPLGVSCQQGRSLPPAELLKEFRQRHPDLEAET